MTIEHITQNLVLKMTFLLLVNWSHLGDSVDLARARLILTVFSYISSTPARALKRFDSILSGIL